MSKPLMIQSHHLSKKYNAQIYLKPEWYGETETHKDKWAKEIFKIIRKKGYKKVVGTSSGNQGLAAAAEAQKHNIECVIISFSTIPPVYKKLYKKYGATLLFAKDGRGRVQKYKSYIKKGYFPLSLTFADRKRKRDLLGIEGYKKTAEEIASELPKADTVVVPTALADHTEGMLRGYRELKRKGKIQAIPQFVLARARYPEGSLGYSITKNVTYLHTSRMC